ncbi:hypothetical protein DM01DRAFT_1326283, partial [Hesseltinella vesiculosa]
MFWKKKEKQQPESNNPFDGGSSFTTESTYSSGSNNGGRYNTYETKDTYGQNRYPSNNEPDNNGYRSRPGPNDDQRRQDLFGNAAEGGRPQGSQQDGGYGRRNKYYEDDDEEVGNIKKQIYDTKQESLQSTRNALQKIREAEESASQSMNMLGQQSTQLANVNRNLDLAKAHTDRAATHADELKQLNRSIFIPVVKNPFNKNARRQREIEKLQGEHAEHMAERERIRQFEYDSSARIEQAQRHNDRVASNSGYRRGRSQGDRNRYQMDGDSEDDQVEDEIDQNLDLLGDATSRLKNMALTMNGELSSQNKMIDRLNEKVDPINAKLHTTTHNLNKIR